MTQLCAFIRNDLITVLLFSHWSPCEFQQLLKSNPVSVFFFLLFEWLAKYTLQFNRQTRKSHFWRPSILKFPYAKGSGLLRNAGNSSRDRDEKTVTCKCVFIVANYLKNFVRTPLRCIILQGHRCNLRMQIRSILDPLFDRVMMCFHDTGSTSKLATVE